MPIVRRFLHKKCAYKGQVRDCAYKAQLGYLGPKVNSFNAVSYVETGDPMVYVPFWNYIMPMDMSGLLHFVDNTDWLPMVDAKLSFQNNNDFNIVAFVAELDETLASFTFKFFKELSFGAVQWGILPFLSDLQNLGTSLIDLFGNASAHDLYTQTLQQNLPNMTVVHPGGYMTGLPYSPRRFRYDLDVNASIRLGGSLSIDWDSLPSSSLATSLLILADELGFHPDLSTLYDLIPLSFMVDWFIPVGDIVSRLHPRGWFKPSYQFNGKYSLNGTVSVRSYYEGKPGDRVTVCGFGKRSVASLTTLKTMNAPGKIEWKCPSWKDLFKTLYLSKKIKIGGVKSPNFAGSVQNISASSISSFLIEKMPDF